LEFGEEDDDDDDEEPVDDAMTRRALKTKTSVSEKRKG
jgi:hypothetical protein